LAPDQQLGSEIVSALQAADPTAVVTVAQRLVLDHLYTSHPDVRANYSDGNSSFRAAPAGCRDLVRFTFWKSHFRAMILSISRKRCSHPQAKRPSS
jgi:hypothetical protein